jgi:drug/metabolite transporter (DMT)-like permease
VNRPTHPLAFPAALVGATFLMASSFIAGKILLARIPPFALLGWRFLLAAAALAAVAAILSPKPDFAALRARGWAVVAAIGLLQTTATMGCMFWAMQTVPPASAAILAFTNPLWVALANRLFFGERLRALQIVGLGCGIIGVALALGGDLTLNPAELIGLAAAFSWAGATILNQRRTPQLPSWWVSFGQTLFGALLLLVIAFALGERWPSELRGVDWGWFVFLAIPGSAISFGLWFVALRLGGATRASAWLFLAPAFTVLLSALILDTPIRPTQAVGGVLIGLALWLVNRGATASFAQTPSRRPVR